MPGGGVGLVATADTGRVEAPVTAKAYFMCAFAAFGGTLLLWELPIPARLHRSLGTRILNFIANPKNRHLLRLRHRMAQRRVWYELLHLTLPQTPCSAWRCSGRPNLCFGSLAEVTHHVHPLGGNLFRCHHRW